MSGQNSELLFEMFPFCRGSDKLNADYSGARVVSATVNKQRTGMSLTLSLTEPAPPFEIRMIEEMIAQDFGFESVTISTEYKRPSSENFKKRRTGAGKASPPAAKPGTVLMGKKTKETAIPVGSLSLERGKATVCGVVCEILSRPIEKRNAWVLEFDLTDYTGTIRVSKYLAEENASQVVKSIRLGTRLTVSGKIMGESTFIKDMHMDPLSIVVEKNEPREDKAEVKRVELHLHTKMSAFDAVADTREAITRAAEWGHPAIAITDHGVVHSFPDAAAAAVALGGRIKVIYGVEGYFQNDVEASGADVSDPDVFPGDISLSSESSRIGNFSPSGDSSRRSDISQSGDNPTSSEAKTSGGRRRGRLMHIVLLARNKTGLNNLYKLITKSHLESFKRFPIIPKSVLVEHREGLIIGSACEAGEVFKAIINRSGPDAIRKIADFYDYLEIMPACNNMFMFYEDGFDVSTVEELQQFNRTIYELGKELGKPVVATGDAHFIDPEQEVFRHVLLNSRKFKNADDDMPLYFRTTDEMLDEFSYLGEDAAYEVVVRNSRMIADMCEVVSPLPPGKLFAPKLDGSTEDLKALVYGRQRELYGDDPPERVKNQVDSEMRDILERGYDVIYMAAQKLVAGSIEHGYLVGSRGSVGSSIVAFLAGITEVNALPAHYRCPDCRNSDFESGIGYACGADMPDKNCPNCGAMYVKDGFNIPFETFLGFDGAKVPDIDLNFSGEYQAQAHKHTMDLFGEEYVFRAGTIGKIAENFAFEYANKYIEATGRTVTKSEINRLARGCMGVRRTTGQHPGGLIVIPQGMEITDFCPAQHPADDKDKGVITTHFDYHCMEDNLIKLDELGHDDPTMIKMLEDMTGIDARDIRLDDPDTMAIFTSPAPLGLPVSDDIIGATGSIGVPEFGTPLTRQMLCDTKPKNFDTLVRLSGFSHGENVWIGNAKELILNGKATVSETIGCRDDIMLFLISKGMSNRDAFKISESIRKGNGLPDGAEDELINHRVPGWYIDSCKKITYLFPKAHAVAYVIMAFRIAWFKVHRPLEFYCAYFYRRSQKDGFDAESMTRGVAVARKRIRDIRRMKKEDVTSKIEETLTTLEACYEFYLRGFRFTGIDIYDSDPTKFLIVDEKTLRPPFVAVSGLGETAANDLAENRNGRKFISIDDISGKCAKVSTTHLRQLKELGALRNLPDSSQMSLF